MVIISLFHSLRRNGVLVSFFIHVVQFVIIIVVRLISDCLRVIVIGLIIILVFLWGGGGGVNKITGLTRQL